MLVQNFGNFSSQGHFLTPPAVGPTTSVYVLDTADMGHAEPDGSNEWEDDLNQRLYNAPGVSDAHTTHDRQSTAGLSCSSDQIPCADPPLEMFCLLQTCAVTTVCAVHRKHR